MHLRNILIVSLILSLICLVLAGVYFNTIRFRAVIIRDAPYGPERRMVTFDFSQSGIGEVYYEQRHQLQWEAHGKWNKPEDIYNFACLVPAQAEACRLDQILRPVERQGRRSDPDLRCWLA